MADLVIRNSDEYKVALRRINALRAAGESADNNEELTRLEGAVAAYVNIYGEPDISKGKPK